MTRELELDPAKTWVSQTLKHERRLTCCRFSPCGKFVAAGGADGRIHIWDLESEKISTLEGHEGWITALAYGARLFAVDFHGGLRAWDETRKPVWSAHAAGACAMAVSPDGSVVATGGHDRVVRLWSAADGKLLKELAGHAGYVYSLAFHPDGKSLASGDLMGVVKHWDAASGKLVRDLDAALLHTRGPDFLADVGGVRSMAFDREGARLACGGLANAKSNTFCPGEPSVVLFDWASGKTGPALQAKDGKVDGTVNELRFLADGTLAAIGEGMSAAALWFWKPDRAEPFHVVPGTSGYGLDLHPDGLRLAAAVFEARGRGGNGRHADRGGYVANTGAVRIYSLHARPAAKKK